MTPERVVEGVSIDLTGQHITEAPYWQREGETVDVVDDEPSGEETVEGVPHPDDGPQRPDVDGQATLEDYTRWSA